MHTATETIFLVRLSQPAALWAGQQLQSLPSTAVIGQVLLLLLLLLVAAAVHHCHPPPGITWLSDAARTAAAGWAPSVLTGWACCKQTRRKRRFQQSIVLM